MTKWKACYTFGWSIEAVEVHRETEASVFILNKPLGRIRRFAKLTSYEKYCDTWESAYVFLVGEAQKKSLAAYRRYEQAGKTLKAVRALTRPE